MEARRYHKNPSAACTTKESLGPPTLPKLHLAQSTHLQATSLVHLCSSTCSSAGIPNASPCFRAGCGPPPFKGCCVQLAPSSAAVASSPWEGGWQLPNTSLGWHLPPLLWKSRMQFCSHTSSSFPRRRSDSPKIQVRSSPKNLGHRGWAGRSCLLRPAKAEADTAELNEEGTRNKGERHRMKLERR